MWLTALLWSSGCLAGAPTEDATSGIIGGEETCAHPEVGLLSTGAGDCTATLVGPTTILTAAHCFDYATGEVWASFVVELCDGVHGVAFVDREESLPFTITTPLGHADLAIGHLTSPLRLDVRPAEIAERLPWPGATVAVYGYGGIDLDGNGAGTKRRREIWWGLPQWASAWGDSGGPALDSDGAIVAVTSWGAPSGWVPVPDQYADPVRHRDELLEIAARMSSP